MNKNVCASCNGTFEPSELHEFLDEVYCSECIDDARHDAGYERCEHCGEWTDDPMTVDERNGRYVETHVFCDEGCAVNAGYQQCPYCDEWHDEREFGVLGNGEVWCDNCYNDHASECQNCFERYPDEDGYYSDDDDEWYCESCHRNACGEGLYEYGYTPSLNMWETAHEPKGNPMFLGVELEVDSGNDRGDFVTELYHSPRFDGHFWMTQDSSLSNGVEVTSHPMTLAYHMDNIELWRNVFETSRKHGFVSYDSGNCGIHIHVNRNFFGKNMAVQDAGGYKMMRLLQRFERQFTDFSRREYNNWCSYKTATDYSPKKKYEPMPEFMEKAKRMKQERAHAQALNFQHYHTYEFRIFRGTLNEQRFFASLGLVNGLAHVAKDHGSIYTESVDWYTLMDDVVKACDNDMCREYLSAYLKERELV